MPISLTVPSAKRDNDPIALRLVQTGMTRHTGLEALCLMLVLWTISRSTRRAWACSRCASAPTWATKHEAFAPPLIKALLSEIAVFPPGTVVRLNTGGVGRVVAVNPHHPLRPRVEIVADGKGQRLAAPKTTDLSEAPFLYISSLVAERAR